MSFAVLAVISTVALLGPLLALPERWHLPGGLASAQLGVPVAAATVGTQLGVLQAGEPAALILGALVTMCMAVLCGALLSRSGRLVPEDGARQALAPKA